MADLNVSVALLLENQAELARELERTGGIAGADFGKGLSANAKKAFDELVAQAEKAAKEANVKFNKQKFQFESVSGDIIPPRALAAIGKTIQGFDQARKAVDTFKSAVSAASRESAASFNLLESAVTGVAISLTSRLSESLLTSLGSIKGLLGGFLELDGELRLAAAAAGETGGYERLGAVVEKVGIDAAGTSKQVAELATSLVRAGFSVSEVEAALPGVVRGAEATGTGFQQFGDIVGNTLRGFGLDVKETARVVDVLTNTANSSNASIEGLGYTFEYTAPIAKALGVSLEDVAAATGLMANAGIQGSVAGTGLREALQKLQQAAGGASPEVLGLSQGQERLQAVMKKLGATVIDAQGKLLPLDQVFISLKGSLEKLSQGDQVQLSNILFGDQAGSKILAITNQSNAAISKMFSDIKNSAGATDTARNAMAGLGLELQQLQGTVDAIGGSIGSVVAAGLRPLVGIANSAAGAISGLPGPVKETGGALITMAAAATAASLGMIALNVAVNNLGGWALLAKSVKSVSALLLGPIGAGTVAVLGLGAAAYGVYGAFNGVDSKTKALIQTMAGLATFVAVMRGIVALQELWNSRLKVSAFFMTLINALQGPAGIGKIAVAVGIASAAYLGMGAIIKETGAETKALTDKSKTLKDEITKLQEQIEQGKKLKVDTSELDKLLSVKMKELQAIENPLEIKVNTEKAEAKIKSLKEQLDKLKDTDSGKPALEAEIRAAEKYRDTLKAANQGITGKAFAKLDKEGQDFVKSQTVLKDRILKLRSEQADASTQEARNRTEKEIQQIQAAYNKVDIKYRASLDVNAINRDLEILKAKKENLEAEPIKRRSRFESADSMAARENEKKKQLATYTEQIYQLETKKVTALNAQVDATRKQSEAAKKQVLTEQQKLELAKAKLSIEQQSIDNATKLINLDKGRLATVQQVADAYQNLASAQAALVQSKFDVQTARNNRDVSVAEKGLGELKDRGASQEEIAAKEREIIDLKKQGEEIDKAAMAAAIESATKRFEIERKILELKQASQAIEQQNAVRSAERGLIDDRKQLLDLQAQLKDPKNSPEQKAAIEEQIKLQQESITLSQAQVKAEKDRLGSMQGIFSLERQTLEAQQQAQSNQLRGNAASKGWEQDLAQGLDRLDQKAGITTRTFKKLVGEIIIPGQPVQKIYEDVVQVEDATKQAAVAWGDVDKAANKALGTVKENTKALESGKKVGDLIKGMAPTGKKADATRLADKQNLQFPNALAGGGFEAELDKLAAGLADADARAKGLSGSIEGLRDEVGRPIDTTAFNFKEINQNFLEESRRALSPDAAREAVQQINFSLSSLRQSASGIGGSISAEFGIAANSILPFSADIDGIKQDLDSFNYSSIVNPFDQWTNAVDQTRLGIDSVASSIGQASTDALAFEQALPDQTQSQQLQAAYDSLAPSVDQAAGSQTVLNDGTTAGISTTQQLAAEWQNVDAQIQAAVTSAQQLAATPAVVARWAGGYASPANSYQVNEFGTESFLSRSGILSLIQAPRYGRWSPSSEGTVIPAGVTAQLQAVGAFDRGPIPATLTPRVQQLMVSKRSGRGVEGAISTATARAIRQQTAAMGRLQDSLDALAGKDWSVRVQTPSNAGLLRTLQGLG